MTNGISLRAVTVLTVVIVLLALPLPALPSPETAGDIESTLSRAREIKDSEPAEALRLGRMAFEQATAEDDPLLIARSRIAMAQALEVLSGYEEALRHSAAAIEYLENSGHTAEYAVALRTRGQALYYQGQYEQALKAFQTSYDVLVGSGRTADIAQALNMMGLVHDQRGDKERALEYYRKAKARMEAAGDKDGVADQLNNIGTLLRQTGDIRGAKAAYDDSIKLRKQTGNKRDLAGTYNNLGVLYHTQKDYEKSLGWMEKAQALQREIGNRHGMARSLYNMGRVETQRGNFAVSESYLEQSLEVARDLEDTNLITHAYGGLKKLERARGNYEAALQFAEKQQESSSEVYDLERQRQIEAMKARFDVAQKEREIALLEEQQKFDALVRNTALGGSLVLLGVIALTYNRYRLKVRANRAIAKKNDELSTLDEIVSAINSHEDFNQVLYVLLRRTVVFFENAEKGAVMILDSDAEHFRLASVFGNRDADIQALAAGFENTVERLTEGGSEIAGGVFLHHGLPFSDETAPDSGKRDVSLIAMAITIDRRIEGFLVLMNARNSEAFQAADAERFARIREHAISALTRARHMDQVKEENRRAERAIAKLRAAESRLKKALEEAERANAAKSQFLANVSHELRTPLNAILGYSEILNAELRDAEMKESVEDARRIHSAGRHLLALINEILDLSKIEAGKTELVLERFPLRELVEDTVAMATPQIEKNGNRLELQFSDDPGEMHTDAVKVRQVLFNLLSNAAKFTREGTITLSVERRSAGGGRSVDEICLKVADTGIGMTAEEADKVFESFLQAKSTTSRDYGGTGLGLTVSRGLCRLMGGDIAVESAPGEGSIFTVTLPAESPAGQTGDSSRKSTDPA